VTLLAGPFVIAAALLALGGALKAVHPADTANALHAVGLPHARLLVRAGGVLEVVVGVGALVVGGTVFAVLVGVSYLAFAGFVVLARRGNTPIASCGCFGKVDTPPSAVHVVVDLVAAGVALAVAAAPTDLSLSHTLAHQPLAGIPFVLLVVVGMYLVFLSFTALPKTMAAVEATRRRRANVA
jgi:hypothetical protein